MIGKHCLRHFSLPSAALSAILWLATAACLMPWDSALPFWDFDRVMLTTTCNR
jgi:hypothetical protein